MKLFKSKKPSEKKPWLKYYGDIPKSIDYPDCTMFELINESAKKFPNSIAYDYYGHLVTYKEFISKIYDASKALKAQKVVENDIVTICMPNTPQAIIVFYAVNLIGAIANMIHPLSAENEIEDYLNRTKSKILVTIDITYPKVVKIRNKTSLKKIICVSPTEDMNLFQKSLYRILKGRKIEINEKNVVRWKEFINIGKKYTGDYKIKRKTEDPALILYSGGTTGTPKGILLSNLNFNALAIQTYLMCGSVKVGDSVLSIMPIFHGFGLGECIHAPLCAGLKCVLVPTFKAGKFDELIKKHKPNFLVGVPTLFEALLKYGKFKNKDLESVTCLVSGGDVISDVNRKKINDLFEKYGSKTKLRIGYGLTEGTCASCLTPEGFSEEGSIGIPFPDTTYKIVKIGTNEEVTYNTDGEICINGPTVMMKYYNNVKETNQVLKIHDDNKLWLHTGDVGYMNKSGMLFFKQRIKRIIISSGYNLYPSHIENVINSHSQVLTSAVIGIDHPYRIQAAKAFVVLKSDVEDKKEVEKSIKEHCAKNLAKYSLPYSYEFRDSLPTTLVGKVAFNKLEEETKNN